MFLFDTERDHQGKALFNLQCPALTQTQLTIPSKRTIVIYSVYRIKTLLHWYHPHWP